MRKGERRLFKVIVTDCEYYQTKLLFRGLVDGLIAKVFLGIDILLFHILDFRPSFFSYTSCCFKLFILFFWNFCFIFILSFDFLWSIFWGTNGCATTVKPFVFHLLLFFLSKKCNLIGLVHLYIFIYIYIFRPIAISSWEMRKLRTACFNFSWQISHDTIVWVSYFQPRACLIRKMLFYEGVEIA